MIQRETFIANLLVGADALRIHPMRTLLSVLGILIGCAALVATMAVSDGMVEFARTQIQRQTSVQVGVPAAFTAASTCALSAKGANADRSTPGGA